MCARMPQACCMCPTCMPVQGTCKPMHAAHTPLYMSYTCRMHMTFTLHAHTKHAIHMAQTCPTRAACAPHAICRLHTFHMHTFMHAQAYYMQECHKLAAHTLYAQTTVCMLYANFVPLMHATLILILHILHAH